VRKCRTYQAHHQAGVEQTKNGLFPLVVCVTPDQPRADKLRRSIDTTMGLDPNLFTVMTRPRRSASSARTPTRSPTCRTNSINSRGFTTTPAHTGTEPANTSPGPQRNNQSHPALAAPGTHFRIRTDTIDRQGKVTIRHAGALHRLGVGRAHDGTPVLILIDTTHATVTGRDTGEVLGTYRIDPDHNYWPKQEKPDHRPGSS